MLINNLFVNGVLGLYFLLQDKWRGILKSARFLKLKHLIVFLRILVSYNGLEHLLSMLKNSINNNKIKLCCRGIESIWPLSVS